MFDLQQCLTFGSARASTDAGLLEHIQRVRMSPCSQPGLQLLGPQHRPKLDKPAQVFRVEPPEPKPLVQSIVVDEPAPQSLDEVFRQPAAPPTTRHPLIHLPKGRKRPQPDPSPDSKPIYVVPLVNPDSQCPTCHWRFPSEYQSEDKHRHLTLARAGACQQDSDNYKQRVESIKLAKRLQEREKLMNGPDDCGSDLRVCPHCYKSLAGSWGPFKQSHISECAAKLLDKELRVIVEESALIPKKKRELQPSDDPYAISFKNLTRRAR